MLVVAVALACDGDGAVPCAKRDEEVKVVERAREPLGVGGSVFSSYSTCTTHIERTGVKGPLPRTGASIVESSAASNMLTRPFSACAASAIASKTSSVGSSIVATCSSVVYKK